MNCTLVSTSSAERMETIAWARNVSQDTTYIDEIGFRIHMQGFLQNRRNPTSRRSSNQHQEEIVTGESEATL